MDKLKIICLLVFFVMSIPSCKKNTAPTDPAPENTQVPVYTQTLTVTVFCTSTITCTFSVTPTITQTFTPTITPRSYGASKQSAIKIIQDSDNGFLVLVSGMGLMKLNSSGAVIWNYTTAGEVVDFIKISDGIIICGNQGYVDPFVIKLDTIGTQQWKKNYGTASDEEVFNRLCEWGTGGFLAAGGLNSERLIVSYLADGNVFETHGNAEKTNLSTIRKLCSSDKYYYIVGDGPGFYNPYIAQVSSIEFEYLSWAKTLGVLGISSVNAIIGNDSGGCFVTGKMDHISNEYFLEFDASGNIKKFKIFDYDCPDAFKKTTDGGFIFAGNNGDSIVVIKTDSDINLQWRKTFAAGYYPKAYDVIQTLDGGYVVCGNAVDTYSHAIIRILKLNSDGIQMW